MSKEYLAKEQQALDMFQFLSSKNSLNANGSETKTILGIKSEKFDDKTFGLQCRWPQLQ